MPNAILTSGLLADDLVSCVDQARQCRADLGLMPYRVWVTRIEWSGDRVGDGAKTTSALEITPQPKVMASGLGAELRPSGLDEDGDIVVTEISRTFSEQELYAPDYVDGDTTLFLYRVEDAHDDGIRPRWYVPKGPPKLNRSGKRKGEMGAVGWTIVLKRAEDPR